MRVANAIAEEEIVNFQLKKNMIIMNLCTIVLWIKSILKNDKIEDLKLTIQNFLTEKNNGFCIHVQ